MTIKVIYDPAIQKELEHKHHSLDAQAAHEDLKPTFGCQATVAQIINDIQAFIILNWAPEQMTCCRAGNEQVDKN
jgi:hypothetical protein